jgi:pimeloyl-ACP methyl ester carboxylesterase
MASFCHDGISFHYRDEGAGLPFVFQHGLGNDISQPFELYQPSTKVRLLAFDCRGHGQTIPLGDPSKLAIPSFADDLAAFLDHLQISVAVVGGTSMGAAIAINFAIRNPGRVLGLVLSRPAWLDQPNPKNLHVLGLIGRLIRASGPEAGREAFLQTENYSKVAIQSRASARSLLDLFCRSRYLETAACLEAIPNSCPCTNLQQLFAINTPTLVLVNRHDPIHPWELGVRLAELIPACALAQITSRSESITKHLDDIQMSIQRFLLRNYL